MVLKHCGVLVDTHATTFTVNHIRVGVERYCSLAGLIDAKNKQKINPAFHGHHSVHLH